MAESKEKVGNNLALVDASELSLVDDNTLNANQLDIILKKTPAKYVKQRPAKGGGTWDYVTGGYVKKCLNLMFGWDWDFEIVDEKIMIEAKEVVVKGRLTCRSGGRTIVKMQYGNKEIIFKKELEFDSQGEPVMITKNNSTWQNKIPGTIPLSVGNDMKAAATDALKKCASEIGIAADIYNKEDFKEIRVNKEKQEYTLEFLIHLGMEKAHLLPEDEQINLQRIVDNKEEASYKKVIDQLKKL